MEKCKVVGCKNRIMKGNFGVKELKGHYGYCQIHKIEGLVKEIKSKDLNKYNGG